MSSRSSHRLPLAFALAVLVMPACESEGPGSPAMPEITGPRFTPVQGFTPTPQIRGNLGAFKFETEHSGFDFELKTRGDADIITTSAVGGPGAHSGWHTHPAPAIVIVKSGTLTSYVVENGVCRKRVYPAGTALIEGTAPHITINEASQGIELSIIFLAPRGQPARIDAPDPGIC